jgi:hypothetical protein
MPDILLQEIIDRGCAVAASEWVTGSGKWTRSRRVPAACAKVPFYLVLLHPEHYPAAYRLLLKHPKVRYIITLKPEVLP